jgi:hypothetical protein
LESSWWLRWRSWANACPAAITAADGKRLSPRIGRSPAFSRPRSGRSQRTRFEQVEPRGDATGPEHRSSTGRSTVDRQTILALTGPARWRTPGPAPTASPAHPAPSLRRRSAVARDGGPLPRSTPAPHPSRLIRGEVEADVFVCAAQAISSDGVQVIGPGSRATDRGASRPGCQASRWVWSPSFTAANSQLLWSAMVRPTPVLGASSRFGTMSRRPVSRCSRAMSAGGIGRPGSNRGRCGPGRAGTRPAGRRGSGTRARPGLVRWAGCSGCPGDRCGDRSGRWCRTGWRGPSRRDRAGAEGGCAGRVCAAVPMGASPAPRTPDSAAGRFVRVVTAVTGSGYEWRAGVGGGGHAMRSGTERRTRPGQPPGCSARNSVVHRHCGSSAPWRAPQTTTGDGGRGRAVSVAHAPAPDGGVRRAAVRDRLPPRPGVRGRHPWRPASPGRRVQPAATAAVRTGLYLSRTQCPPLW